MELLLVFGVILVVFGVFLYSMEEKKFRTSKLFTCVDLGETHEWAYNAKKELQCRVCYLMAGQRNETEE